MLQWIEDIYFWNAYGIKTDEMAIWRDHILSIGPHHPRGYVPIQKFINKIKN